MKLVTANFAADIAKVTAASKGEDTTACYFFDSAERAMIVRDAAIAQGFKARAADCSGVGSYGWSCDVWAA